MIKDMSERNKTENSRNKNSKEEKLFRAMSGVDEDLLLRSEQSGSGNTGKVHKFPTRYVSRIVAACLCFVVAGVLYVAMSSTKMADSTGSAAMATPQLAYSITADTAIPEGNEAAAELPEGAMAEAASELPESALGEAKLESAMSEAADNEMPVTQQDSGAQEKQDSQMSAEDVVSGGTGEMSGTDTTAATKEEKVMKKQDRHLPGKMTRKGL